MSVSLHYKDSLLLVSMLHTFTSKFTWFCVPVCLSSHVYINVIFCEVKYLLVFIFIFLNILMTFPFNNEGWNVSFFSDDDAITTLIILLKITSFVFWEILPEIA